MGSWSEIVSGWKKDVLRVEEGGSKHGIVQNGTKQRIVRLATQLLKQSELRGQIIVANRLYAILKYV